MAGFEAIPFQPKEPKTQQVDTFLEIEGQFEARLRRQVAHEYATRLSGSSDWSMEKPFVVTLESEELFDSPTGPILTAIQEFLDRHPRQNFRFYIEFGRHSSELKLHFQFHSFSTRPS